MKLITYYGEVYRLTNLDYIELLKRVARNEDWTPSDLGKKLGIVEQNVTDLDAELAIDLLKDLGITRCTTSKT